MHDLFAKFALNTDKFDEDKNIKFIQVIKHPKGNSAKRVVYGSTQACIIVRKKFVCLASSYSDIYIYEYI
jgi:hypothetical protein